MKKNTTDKVALATDGGFASVVALGLLLETHEDVTILHGFDSEDPHAIRRNEAAEDLARHTGKPFARFTLASANHSRRAYERFTSHAAVALGRYESDHTRTATKAVQIAAEAVDLGCREVHSGHYARFDKPRGTILHILQAVNQAIGYALNRSSEKTTIETKLIRFSGPELILMADSLGKETWEGFLHSWDGDYNPGTYSQERGSILRAKAFQESELYDPKVVKLKESGALPAWFPNSGYTFKP